METIIKTPEKTIIRTETSTSLANAIRRSVEEIQTLAVDEVEIFKNDSALYDEVLAHRIGLIPLKTDEKMSAKTSIDLKISKMGPGTVYSGDLEGNAKIVFDKIPLTILEEKQQVEIVATAKLGDGTEHTKHVPGLLYYRNLQQVKSGNVKIDHLIENTKGRIKPEKKSGNWICDLKDAEIDQINALDKNSIKDSNELLIFIESFGHLESEKILKKAVQILEKNLDALEKDLK